MPTPTMTPDGTAHGLLTGWTEIELGVIILLAVLIVIFMAAMLLDQREAKRSEKKGNWF